MFYRVCFLTDQDISTGFRLGGADVVAVKNEEDCLRAFQELLQDSRIGLIVIQENFLPSIEREYSRKLKQRDWPLIISYPSPRPIGEEKDHIAEMVKEAIGYYVKLR